MNLLVNPIALRKAKNVYNFGFSECNRIKKMGHAAQLVAHLIQEPEVPDSVSSPTCYFCFSFC